MNWLIFAIGLVMAVEGLVFALAPSRITQVLQLLAELPVAARRGIGLAALALGVVLIWLSGLPGAG